MPGERDHLGDLGLGGDPAKGQKEANFEIRFYDGRMSNEEKPSRGRPSRAGVAGTPITIRLTPDEREAYEAAAEAEKLPLAVWIRKACEVRLKRSKKQSR